MNMVYRTDDQEGTDDVDGTDMVDGTDREDVPDREDGTDRVELPPGSMPYPSPVVLVSCRGEDGRANIITVAWMSKVCMKPPTVAVGVGKTRFSNPLIADGGDFVVNVPSRDQLEAVNICGTRSGRDTDKFQAAGLTAEPSLHVRSPTIAQCPASIECRLVKTVDLGSHHLFLGEMVTVRVTRDIVDEKGGVDFREMDPLLYLSPGYWTVDERVGIYNKSSSPTHK